MKFTLLEYNRVIAYLGFGTIFCTSFFLVSQPLESLFGYLLFELYIELHKTIHNNGLFTKNIKMNCGGRFASLVSLIIIQVDKCL